MTYPIINVPADAANQLEQLGTKSKFWYHDQYSDERFLFKQGRPGTGENWAEKACCEISELLGIPHALYDFAVCDENDGVVSPTFVPEGGRLIHGNELLAKSYPDYDDGRAYRVRQHTVKLVLTFVGRGFCKLPIGCTDIGGMTNAADVYAGYLMLDALVSNQDRHHENWGMVILAPYIYLAPSYDHASSLGRNESDDKRIDMLTTKDQGRNVEAYVKRARSAFYGDLAGTKPLSTLEAFSEAAKQRSAAGLYWLERLRNIDHTEFKVIFDSIPAEIITEPAKDFALKMLEINIKRLLSLSITL